MPKFLTSGAERLMENFIESSGGKGAIYDEEMTLIWTNYHEFFDKFDLKKMNEDAPIIFESSFSAELKDGRAVLNITPVYRSPRVISAYICIIREAYDIFKMMNKTVISDFSDNILRKNAYRIEKLAELNSAVREAAMELEDLQATGSIGDCCERIAGLAQKQEEMLFSMKNETRFYIDTCFNETDSTNGLCNVTLLFSSVCGQAAESFDELNRKVRFTGVDKDCYIASEGGSLLLGFLHLLRAHIILSSPKSSVSVESYIESLSGNADLFCVKVKTTLLDREKIDDDLLTTSRAYRELAKKVVLYNYDGTFECSDLKKNMQTVLKIPTVKKNRGAMLNSVSSDYGGVEKTYLADIVYREKNGDI